MRLLKHLNEVTKLTDEEVDEILNMGFNNFNELMEKRWNLWPLIFLSINTAFNPFNIAFLPKWITIIFKTSKGVLANTSNKGLITFFLTKNDFTNLKSSSGINTFKEKIKGTLTHELIHVKQFKKIISKVDIKTKISPEKYFFNHLEIEAYARETVQELKKGKSDILESYYMIKSHNKKGWQKFLKKVYQYVDIENNSNINKNLSLQMKEDAESYEELLNYIRDNKDIEMEKELFGGIK